jgi:hypothetical protein
MRSEDPNDPERRPAAEYGVTIDDEDGGHTSCFFLDEDQSLEIHQRHDGTWVAAIEDVKED